MLILVTLSLGLVLLEVHPFPFLQVQDWGLPFDEVEMAYHLVVGKAFLVEVIQLHRLEREAFRVVGMVACRSVGMEAFHLEGMEASHSVGKALEASLVQQLDLCQRQLSRKA
jgi:hypothetical protein